MDKNIPEIDIKKLEAGYVWAPYITIISSTSINGETVWYKNKWKNLLLKIKFFFIKPRYLKDGKGYSNKTIDSGLYGTFKINDNE